MTEINEDEPLLGRNNTDSSVQIDLENRDPKLINEEVAKVIYFLFLFIYLYFKLRKHVNYDFWSYMNNVV